MRLFIQKVLAHGQRAINSTVGHSAIHNASHCAQHGLAHYVGVFGSFVAKSLSSWGNHSAEFHSFAETRRILASDTRPTQNVDLGAVAVAGINQWSTHSAEAASFTEASRILKK